MEVTSLSFPGFRFTALLERVLNDGRDVSDVDLDTLLMRADKGPVEKAIRSMGRNMIGGSNSHESFCDLECLFRSKWFGTEKLVPVHQGEIVGYSNLEELLPAHPPSSQPLFLWSEMMAQNSHLMRVLCTPKNAVAEGSGCENAADSDRLSRYVKIRPFTNENSSSCLDESENNINSFRRPTDVLKRRTIAAVNAQNLNVVMPSSTSSNNNSGGSQNNNVAVASDSQPQYNRRRHDRRLNASDMTSNIQNSRAPPSPGISSSTPSGGEGGNGAAESLTAITNSHCLCNSEVSNTSMICCDDCAVWYHAQCIGLTDQEVELWPEDVPWMCPTCVPKNCKIRKKETRKRRRT